MNAKPKSQPDQIRSIPVKFYVTPKEKEELVRIAESEGYGSNGMSEFIRRVTLGYLIVDREKAGLE